MFGEQFRTLAFLEAKRFQFAHLVAQQFEARVAVCGGSAKRCHFRCQGAVLLGQLLYRREQGLVVAMGIEQAALGVAAHERQKLLLAVNIDEQLVQFANPAQG